jgi:hypothetical protein
MFRNCGNISTKTLWRFNMTDIDTFVDDLTRLRDEYKNKIEEAGEEVIKSVFKGLFDNSPALLAIKWSQYTPFFNDGDECVFGVYDPSYLIDLSALNLSEEINIGYYHVDDDSEDGKQVWIDSLTYRAKVDELYPARSENRDRVVRPGTENDRYPTYDYVGNGTYWAYVPIPGCENIKDTVRKIFTLPDDVFRDVFGDHVQIIVTPKEITVNEYYHD